MKESGRGRYRANYTPQDLTDAYIKVKEENLPVERVAKQFGIPITTLRDRVRGKIDTDTLKSGRSPMFTNEQEAFLSQHLITMAEIGYGYSRRETINLATDYAIHLGIRDSRKPLTKKWFYNFLDRWPELRVKKPRSLEVARAKSATRPVLDRYFEELNKVLVKNNLKDNPQAIYNVDEKGLSLQHKPPKIVTGHVYKAQAVTAGKSKIVTIIGGGNAVGNQVPPYFVFHGARMLPELLDGCTAGTNGTVTESGWSNTDVFTKYMMEHLEPQLQSRGDGSKVLVLYDGHKSHVSLGLIEWATSNGIILFVLPPHCSHLIQPMDVSCFGPLELAWNAACHNYMRESGGNVVTRMDVCRIACKACTTSLSTGNIQSAFQRCGIHPFNPSVVSDIAIAPSLAFAPAVAAEVGEKPQPEEASVLQNAVDCNAKSFLEKRGAEVLKNVPPAKIRKTLSKIVAGKAITEQSVVEKIKEHVKRNPTKTPQKTIVKPKCRKTKSADPVPNTSKAVICTEASPRDSLSSFEFSEEEDKKVCCICNNHEPPEPIASGLVGLL